MEKNEILEAAKNNKKVGNEYEKKESRNSTIIASAVAIILGMILFFAEYFIKDTINISLLVVCMTVLCVQSLYEGIKTKKLFLIILGIIKGVIVIFLLLSFVISVVF